MSRSMTSAAAEKVASASSEDIAPCVECGALLSRYVSKCPACGHHCHRYSHDEIRARREFRQKCFLVLTAMGICLVALLLAILLY